MSAPHIDYKRPAAYNADNPVRGHRVRPGESALLHTAVGHFPAKGGDADGKRTLETCAAIRGMRSPHPCGDRASEPKSVLTARLAPERST